MDTSKEKVTFLELGVQLGNLTKRWNPKMQPYLYKRGRKIHLLDVQKSIDGLAQVKSQVAKLIKNNDHFVILFVGTSPQFAEVIKKAALNCNSPYLVHRWLGGFLTNFGTIMRRINYLQSLITLRQSNEFAAFPKKKQGEIEREINKLNKIYEGVIDLKRKPNAILVVGLQKEKTAVREARLLGIPVIAICNTDGDPDLVDHLIPGNDYAKEPVDFLVSSLAETIKEAKPSRGNELSDESEIQSSPQ